MPSVLAPRQALSLRARLAAPEGAPNRRPACLVKSAGNPNPTSSIFKLLGVVTKDELMSAINTQIDMALQYPDILLHTLIDAGEIKQLPSLPAMGHELKRMIQESPNRNVSTLYGVSALIRFSLEVLMRIAPMRHQDLPSREEALAFTHKMIESEQRLPDPRVLRADMRKDFPQGDGR